MDAHANFAFGTILTAPSPASSGTTLVLNSGQGALMPAAPFNATVWPVGLQPLGTNAEIVRVTGVVGDTATIVRAQEGTSARAILIGDQFANTLTVKVLTDIEAAANVISNALSVETAARIAKDDTLSAGLSVVSHGLSVETAARVVKDDVLSQAVSVVSQAVSVVSARGGRTRPVGRGECAWAVAVERLTRMPASPRAPRPRSTRG